MIWMVMAAAAGNPWIDMDPDIHTSHDVPLPVEEVHRRLQDLPKAAAWFSEDCVKDWAFGVPDRGVGARARVTWVPSWMHRRLTLEVKAPSASRVDWDHLSERGFIVTWRLTPTDAGTHVDVTIPLNPPGWPLRKVYHVHIKPAWETCMSAAIRSIGGSE